MKVVQLHYTSKNIRDSITKNSAAATERLDHIDKGEEMVKGKGQTSKTVTEGNRWTHQFSLGSKQELRWKETHNLQLLCNVRWLITQLLAVSLSAELFKVLWIHTVFMRHSHQSYFFPLAVLTNSPKESLSQSLATPRWLPVLLGKLQKQWWLPATTSELLASAQLWWHSDFGGLWLQQTHTKSQNGRGWKGPLWVI